MGKRITSHDVARRAGVSRSAVSLVLNGRAEGAISAQNQEAVLRAVNELGYRPNTVARSLRNASTHTIGVVTDSILSTGFGGDMVNEATRAAAARGYLLLVVDCDRNPVREQEAVQVLKSRQCDGLMLAAEHLREWQPPPGFADEKCLLLDAVDPSGQVPGVVSDEVGGARSATELLLHAGHREIAYLTGESHYLAAGMRVQGHTKALAAAGLGPQLVECGWDISDGLRVGLRLLDSPDRPTAVLCANDRVAAGVFLAAARLGLSIPDELSVVGYDNDRNVAPHLGLTTISLPHRAMGARAIEVLLDVMAGRAVEPTRLLVDSPVVERASVAPPSR